MEVTIWGLEQYLPCYKMEALMLGVYIYLQPKFFCNPAFHLSTRFLPFQGIIWTFSTFNSVKFLIPGLVEGVSSIQLSSTRFSGNLRELVELAMDDTRRKGILYSIEPRAFGTFIHLLSSITLVITVLP